MLNTAFSQLETAFYHDDKIPELLRSSKAIVVALMTDQGMLLDANEGFYYLFKHLQADDLASASLQKYFSQPVFSDLNVVSSMGHEPVYSGLLTMGDPYATSYSLIGSVFNRNHKIYLMAEHDVEVLERLTASVIKLNDEMSEMQRKLYKSNRMLERQKQQATKLMLTDELTGLPNRRAYIEYMKKILPLSVRKQHPLCLSLCDIDFFKSVNDVYGHDVGDSALKSFSNTLRNNLREYDFIARVGGEEFSIVMPETIKDDAVKSLNRVRNVVSKTIAPLMDKPLTASFGVVAHKPAMDAENLLKQADLALYKAKETGRNKVVFI